MKSRILLSAALLVLVSLLAGSAWWLMTAGERVDDEHYRRGETDVAIANMSGHPLRLYRAGQHLADTVAIPIDPGPDLWLAPGNYFLRAAGTHDTLHLPIPLTGYRSGPDYDGRFVLTVRPFPDRTPPSQSDSLPSWAYIPSGNFMMGDRNNPRECQHVWLSGYFIGRFEVTNGEFRRFLSDPEGYPGARYWTEAGRKWKAENPTRCSAAIHAGGIEDRRFGRADQPVTWVNWFEANAYCAWMTGKFGGKDWQFALPNDAEWEKASRGPDNLDYALSMTVSDAEVKLYNWKKNPEAPETVVGVRATMGRYIPNRYGLYHMTGNVAEWTQSVDRPFNREHPYAEDERNHDETPGQRTVRGGSWYSASIAYLSTPYRDAFLPSHSTQDIGFRVVARLLP